MGRLRALDYIRRGKRIRVVTPGHLFKTCDMDKGMVLVPAFIGAPQIMYEQGVSSAETTRALECLKEVYEIGGYKEGDIVNTEGTLKNSLYCPFISALLVLSSYGTNS